MRKNSVCDVAFLAQLGTDSIALGATCNPSTVAMDVYFSSVLANISQAHHSKERFLFQVSYNYADQDDK